MKHTPGPWTYEKVNSRDELVYCRIKAKNVIGFAGTYCGKKTKTIPDEEAMANTRLIAAAPELLEALNDLLEETYGDGSHWANKKLQEQRNRIIERAHNAIAKAEGEEK